MSDAADKKHANYETKCDTYRERKHTDDMNWNYWNLGLKDAIVPLLTATVGSVLATILTNCGWLGNGGGGNNGGGNGGGGNGGRQGSRKKK